MPTNSDTPLTSKTLLDEMTEVTAETVVDIEKAVQGALTSNELAKAIERVDVACDMYEPDDPWARDLRTLLAAARRAVPPDAPTSKTKLTSFIERWADMLVEDWTHADSVALVEIKRRLAEPPNAVDAKELAEWRRLRTDRQAAHLACLRGVIALHPDDALHFVGTSRKCALCDSPDEIRKSLLERLYDRFGAYSTDPLWLEVSKFMTGGSAVLALQAKEIAP